MPKPRGWTEKELKRRDECVSHLMREGVPEGRTEDERDRSPRSRAYAICTIMVERQRRGHS